MTSTTGKLFGSVFKLGQQLVTSAVSAISKLANQQEFDAVMAACVLVANADGSTSEVERASTIAQASSHPSLKDFGTDAIAKAFKDYHELLGMDRQLGVETLLGKIAKITDMEARTRIVSIAVAIANADGDFSAVEKEMVARIRSAS